MQFLRCSWAGNLAETCKPLSMILFRVEKFTLKTAQNKLVDCLLDDCALLVNDSCTIVFISRMRNTSAISNTVYTNYV